MFYINKLIVRQIDMILKWFVDNTMIFLLKNWVVLNFCSRLYCIHLPIVGMPTRKLYRPIPLVIAQFLNAYLQRSPPGM